MAKGRKALPNKVKELRGTDQPVRMIDEVEYERITKISVPRILTTTRARKIYRERSQVLINMQLLQEPDQDLLVAYANTLDLYYQAIELQKDQELVLEMINTKGQTMKVISPYIKLQKELLDIVNKLSGHFGFSPSSRASLNVQGPKEKMTEFEKLLSGKS